MHPQYPQYPSAVPTVPGLPQYPRVLCSTRQGNHFKRKNAAPSASGAEELAQCQRDLRDAQIRSLLKDDEIQALELHIHILKGLMHAHDIALPPETSESATARTSSRKRAYVGQL